MPGDTSAATAEAQFAIRVRNVGDAVGTEDLTIEDHLPLGLVATKISWPDPKIGLPSGCTGEGTAIVKCKLQASLLKAIAMPPGDISGSQLNGSFSAAPSGYLPTIYIDVSVPKNKSSGEGTNIATVAGGGAPSPISDVDQIVFGSEPSSFGVVPGSFAADMFTAAYPFGAPARQASDHPFEFRTNFDVTETTGVNDGSGGDSTRYIAPNGAIRTVDVTLPRGAIGNPEAVAKCDPTDFAEEGAVANSTACPPNTQVGYLNVAFNDGTRNYGGGNAVHFDWGFLSRVPVYNLKPPKGTLVDLGFNAGGLAQAHVYATLDPSNNYTIKSVTPNVSSLVQVRGAEVTIWGVPGDPSHDRFRFYPKAQEGGVATSAPFEGPIRPFWTNPMDCGAVNGGTLMRLDSYERPNEFSVIDEYPEPLDVTGCDDPRFRFEPDISLQPTDRHAGAPTGLGVHLEVPQRNDEVSSASDLYAVNGAVKAIATPPIKDAVITFPEGMTISPSAAQGLQTCSPVQVGLNSDAPIACPDASQYGTLILRSPALPQTKTVEGRIFVAEQDNDPSHGFLALYLGIEDEELGLRVKLRGGLTLDPKTGQITTTFENLPQLPVSDMQMNVKGGVRAGLVNPSTCGKKTIAATFYSWQDPTTPHTVKSSYDITEKPDGSPCVNNLAERPFGPAFEAGTLNNTAGTFSPFALRLTRTDDDQEFSQLGVKTPGGLLARLAGMSRCSESGIAQALSRTGRGQGALEQANPSCPASSLIGMIDVGAGVGVPLTYVPGKIYLAGPYHGSPLSFVVITPAVVGPFDIGVITVRTGIHVDPQTTQVSVSSDPFPQVFQGIPVRVRDLRVKLDQPGWVLNPTSCAAKQIEAHVTGAGGDVFSTGDDTAANLSQRFQAADCASLPFKPKLSFHLSGGTHRGAHPALKAVAKGRPGDANIGGVSVAFPHSEFLDQSHIGTVCTRVQFAAKQCPAAAIYGHVTAKSPLFDETFSGPVYLRSSSHPLPDLVAVLNGPASLPIEVDLVSRIDSINGGIRNSFEVVPDAPVERFTLTTPGGKKAILVNSTNLCKGTHRATAKFTAQSGKRITLRPQMQADCGKSARGGGGKKGRRSSR